MHSRKTNLILQKRAISSSWLTGTPWGILENILLRHALADNIIGLLGFDLMFSFFFFFSGFLMFWFVRMNTCLKKQELGYWGICLFQALFPNLVSVGIARCSWYFRGLILGPGFSDVGQKPHSASLYRKSILEDLLLSLVRIQNFWRHFLPLSSNSSRPALPLVTPTSFWKDSYADGSTRLSTRKGHEMDFWPWIHFTSGTFKWRAASG